MRGQRNAILTHLREFGSITSQEAFKLYGVTRLAAIIYDLKQAGYYIITIMVDGKTRFGDSCKYAKYLLVEEKEDV